MTEQLMAEAREAVQNRRGPALRRSYLDVQTASRRDVTDVERVREAIGSCDNEQRCLRPGGRDETHFGL